jgi:hypothetical protein
MHRKILSCQNTLAIYCITLTETISICPHITHVLFPAQNRIFSQQVLRPTEYLGGHMYHKEGVNYTLNKQVKKMLRDNTTSCHKCTFHIFLYIYILENFIAWECFSTCILGRHTYNLFSHNLQNVFYYEASRPALVATQSPTQWVHSSPSSV